jgi:hypothetical protein
MQPGVIQRPLDNSTQLVSSRSIKVYTISDKILAINEFTIEAKEQPSLSSERPKQMPRIEEHGPSLAYCKSSPLPERREVIAIRIIARKPILASQARPDSRILNTQKDITLRLDICSTRQCLLRRKEHTQYTEVMRLPQLRAGVLEERPHLL